MVECQFCLTRSGRKSTACNRCNNNENRLMQNLAELQKLKNVYYSKYKVFDKVLFDDVDVTIIKVSFGQNNIIEYLCRMPDGKQIFFNEIELSLRYVGGQ